jgi:hypothetical protein
MREALPSRMSSIIVSSAPEEIPGNCTMSPHAASEPEACGALQTLRIRGFLSTQYDLCDRLQKNLYVIEKDLYVRIRRLRLILYDWFF